VADGEDDRRGELKVSKFVLTNQVRSQSGLIPLIVEKYSKEFRGSSGNFDFVVGFGEVGLVVL